MKPSLFSANAAVKVLLLSLVLLCACQLADASSLHKREQRLVAGKHAALKSKHKEEGPKVIPPAGSKLPTAKTDTSTLTPHGKEKVASTKISKSEVIKTEESSNDSPAVKQPASKKPGSMVKGMNERYAWVCRSLMKCYASMMNTNNLNQKYRN